MQLQDYDTSNQYAATVVSSERMTPDSTDEVRELVLDVAGDGLQFGVGQSVGVLAPGDAQFGQDAHLRLYSVSDLPGKGDNGTARIKLAVKRCFYVDDYSGERYPGRASNYLCDAKAGDKLTLTGPFGLPFEVPAEKDALLILVATSTGIAPFRAFLRHLFEADSGFQGRVVLFYGGRRSVDLVYLNDARDDLSRYGDDAGFSAFQALSTRPHWTDDIDWGSALASSGEQLWQALESARTYVYVAGLEKDQKGLHAALSALAGDAAAFARRKAEMAAGRRWVELLY